jgi:hypothetical protein
VAKRELAVRRRGSRHAKSAPGPNADGATCNETTMQNNAHCLYIYIYPVGEVDLLSAQHIACREWHTHTRNVKRAPGASCASGPGQITHGQNSGAINHRHRFTDLRAEPYRASAACAPHIPQALCKATPQSKELTQRNDVTRTSPIDRNGARTRRKPDTRASSYPRMLLATRAALWGP